MFFYPVLTQIERQAAGVCRLKLGDFGLAMVVTEPVFTICGTPTYVAPEILYETGRCIPPLWKEKTHARARVATTPLSCCVVSAGYGVEVDVWALGVILYILLCGFPPFRSRDRDQEELFQLIKQGQLHFLSPYWDTISDGAETAGENVCKFQVVASKNKHKWLYFCFWSVCFAEAKGLVRGLVQPEPTERLTAAQALLHPWVKAMASLCRQRAPSDKSRGNAGGSGAAERVQGPTRSDGAERRKQGGSVDSEPSEPGGRPEPGSGSETVDGQDAQHPEREQVTGSPAKSLRDEYQHSDPLTSTRSQSKQSPGDSPPPLAGQQQSKPDQKGTCDLMTTMSSSELN